MAVTVEPRYFMCFEGKLDQFEYTGGANTTDAVEPPAGWGRRCAVLGQATKSNAANGRPIENSDDTSWHSTVINVRFSSVNHPLSGAQNLIFFNCYNRSNQKLWGLQLHCGTGLGYDTHRLRLTNKDGNAVGAFANDPFVINTMYEIEVIWTQGTSETFYCKINRNYGDETPALSGVNAQGAAGISDYYYSFQGVIGSGSGPLTVWGAGAVDAKITLTGGSTASLAFAAYNYGFGRLLSVAKAQATHDFLVEFTSAFNVGGNTAWLADRLVATSVDDSRRLTMTGGTGTVRSLCLIADNDNTAGPVGNDGTDFLVIKCVIAAVLRDPFLQGAPTMTIYAGKGTGASAGAVTAYQNVSKGKNPRLLDAVIRKDQGNFPDWSAGEHFAWGVSTSFDGSSQDIRAYENEGYTLYDYDSAGGNLELTGKVNLLNGQLQPA